MTTITAIVKEHLKASARMRRSFKGSPQKAKQFLIKAGVLNKQGTKLASRYR